MRSRIAMAVGLLISIIAFETYFLSRKFPPFVPTPWVREPVHLADFAGFRIGIVRGRHGAEFVRLNEKQPALQHLRDPDFAEVESQMRRQLRSIPMKLAFEILWYFVILFGVVYLPIAHVLRRSASCMRTALTFAITSFAAAFLLQAPLFVGYDTSIFSTWYGPGAYSWSRPHPALTGALGIAVSYRFVLEALTAQPFNLSWRVLETFTSFEMPAWLFHLSVSTMYAVVGAFVGIIVQPAVRMRRGLRKPLNSA